MTRAASTSFSQVLPCCFVGSKEVGEFGVGRKEEEEGRKETYQVEDVGVVGAAAPDVVVHELVRVLGANVHRGVHQLVDVLVPVVCFVVLEGVGGWRKGVGRRERRKRQGDLRGLQRLGHVDLRHG